MGDRRGRGWTEANVGSSALKANTAIGSPSRLSTIDNSVQLVVQRSALTVGGLVEASTAEREGLGRLVV